MALLASETRSEEQRPVQPWLVIWIVALAVVIVLFLLRDSLAFAVRYPADAVIPAADWVSVLMKWLKTNISSFTRLITAYARPGQGYTARRAMESVHDPSRYDHLSRFGEWDLTDTALPEDVGTEGDAP